MQSRPAVLSSYNPSDMYTMTSRESAAIVMMQVSRHGLQLLQPLRTILTAAVS